MSKDRYVCEVCNKGFLREQNLELHERGHNLPWNLKQRGTKEVKRKLYLCLETTCPHHEPTRALGDLTSMKKHFLRKHGEKKIQCSRCSKKYVVQSDYKAHTKTCRTRDYICECDTLFFRRDNYRASCDALMKEGARNPTNMTPSLIPGGTTLALFSPLYITSPQDIQNPSTAQMSSTSLFSIDAPLGSTSTDPGATDQLQNLFDAYQPNNPNGNYFGAFGDNRNGHLHEMMNYVGSGSSSFIFGGTYNEQVQVVDMEDQYFCDELNENLTAFDGEGMGFDSLELDAGLARSFLGMGQQMVNKKVGDVHVSSIYPRAGNTSTASQSPGDFEDPDFK